MSRRAVTWLAWLLCGTSVLLAAAGLGNGHSGMEAIPELSVGCSWPSSSRWSGP